LKIAAVAGRVLLAAFAATAAPPRVEDAGLGSSNELPKGLKTLSDPQRKLVYLRPAGTHVPRRVGAFVGVAARE